MKKSIINVWAEDFQSIRFGKIALAAVLAFTITSCDTANNPSLAGHWLGGGTGKKPRDMELFKDGTGVCDGVGVSWKVEDKRLMVLSPTLDFASDYEVSGRRLTLSDNAGKAMYVNINDMKYPRKDTFTDSRDGKKYGSIEIGSQIWMSENLNYEAKYSKCYENDPSGCQKYGRLYDWSTALKACPKGWHLPSDAEWQTLVDFAGGDNVAGQKLKSKSGWNSNGNGTDDYGFSALPGGNGDSSGDFSNVGISSIWWSATNGNASSACFWYIHYIRTYVYRSYLNKSDLYSVRCVQD